MTDAELDSAYAELCRTMTHLGERRTELYLARFAVLAMLEIDDAAKISRLVAAAADGLAADEGDGAAG
ncbi:MAG: hypothetical protein NW223_10690 [Hyphomicrobiaceae bacterium]|nr:hypothetical protein [Hyphomicrobiaceae bacterium]